MAGKPLLLDTELATATPGERSKALLRCRWFAQRRSLTVAPTFDPSLPTIHTCWPCSNGPRVITLSKTPSSVAGLSSTSITIASVSPKPVSKVRLSSTFGLYMNCSSRVLAKYSPSLSCRVCWWSQQINAPKRSRPVRAQARFGRRISRV